MGKLGILAANALPQHEIHALMIRCNVFIIAYTNWWKVFALCTEQRLGSRYYFLLRNGLVMSCCLDVQIVLTPSGFLGVSEAWCVPSSEDK